MTQYFKYRIVEKTYKNYVAYDDGPGSATSIDATCHAQVVEIWKNAPESFGNELLEHGYPHLHMKIGSDDDYYEYSYVIERTAVENNEWQYLGQLPRTVAHQCSYCGDELEYKGSDCRYCDRP
ncbi:MAG: hypothetical protein ACI92I_000513 [Acidimicrobiales bacterium]|jgi:hypothetical protein